MANREVRPKEKIISLIKNITKMRKEVKIGIYAVVILLCAWAGIRFLSGLDIFGRTHTYTAHYESVNGLQDAAQVVIRGVKVGQVTGVAINKENGGVDVTLSVSSDFEIPNDSKAVMFSAGLMGGKAIEIKIGQTTTYLKSGDAILTDVQLDMFDTWQMSWEISRSVLWCCSTTSTRQSRALTASLTTTRRTSLWPLQASTL